MNDYIFAMKPRRVVSRLRSATHEFATPSTSGTPRTKCNMEKLGILIAAALI